jgi:hypothetical protein
MSTDCSGLSFQACSSTFLHIVWTSACEGFPWHIKSTSDCVIGFTAGLQFDLEPFELCECEKATANNGLNCRKEGWFVAGFEDEARFVPWVSQLVLVTPRIGLLKVKFSGSC